MLIGSANYSTVNLLEMYGSFMGIYWKYEYVYTSLIFFNAFTKDKVDSIGSSLGAQVK